jgi:hypothetical protein
MSAAPSHKPAPGAGNFLRTIVERELERGAYGGRRCAG